MTSITDEAITDDRTPGSPGRRTDGSANGVTDVDHGTIGLRVPSADPRTLGRAAGGPGSVDTGIPHPFVSGGTDRKDVGRSLGTGPNPSKLD